MMKTGKLTTFFPSYVGPLILLASLAGCSQKVPPPPSASDLLQKVPAGNAAKYPDVRQTKNWRNPYLVIRPDGVGLVTSLAANEERILKPEELLDVLAQLPQSAWPYGRVVAILVEVGPASSEQEKIVIRRNRGVVAGELQGAHVAIEWEPSPGA